MTNAESRYWIQEYNEPGKNWIDSVGFDEKKSHFQAIQDLRATRRTFKTRRYRLIIRTDARIN